MDGFITFFTLRVPKNMIVSTSLALHYNLWVKNEHKSLKKHRGVILIYLGLHIENKIR